MSRGAWPTDAVLMRRRRGSRLLIASRVALAAGPAVALAGAIAPSGAAPGAAPVAAPAAPDDLSRLLNPSGVQPINPAEEMVAQQDFAARHYGAFGLATPRALSAAIERGVQQAATVAASRQFPRH